MSEEEKKAKWLGSLPYVVAPLPTLALKLLTQNRESSAHTPTLPTTGTVSPSKLSTVGSPPPPAYWESWWKPSERLATPSPDYTWDGFPWFATVKGTTTAPSDGALCPSFEHGMNADYHGELQKRGLGQSLFAWPLKPEHAEAIWRFRHDKTKVSRLAYSTRWGTRRDAAVASLLDERTAARARGDDTRVNALNGKIDAIEEDNLCHMFAFDGTVLPKALFEEAWASIASLSAFAKNACAVFWGLTQPPAAEGWQNSVVTWDDTFSYGIGFALNSVDFLTDALVGVAPAAMPADYRSALPEMLTYLRMGGVDFDSAAPRRANGFLSRLRIAHVEERGSKYVGWVLTGDAAFACIKHEVRICDVWATMGSARSLPTGSSDKIQHALIFLQAWQQYQIYSAIPLLASTLSIAAFTYVCHGALSAPVSVSRAHTVIGTVTPSIANDLRIAQEIIRQVVLHYRFHDPGHFLIWDRPAAWAVHVKLFTNFFHDLKKEGTSQTVQYPFVALRDYAVKAAKADETIDDAIRRIRASNIVLTKTQNAASGQGYLVSEDLPDGEWVVDT